MVLSKSQMVLSTSKEKNLFQCLKKVATKKIFFFKRPKKLQFNKII
jgi:hypothetical protein